MGFCGGLSCFLWGATLRGRQWAELLTSLSLFPDLGGLLSGCVHLFLYHQDLHSPFAFVVSPPHPHSRLVSMSPPAWNLGVWHTAPDFHPHTLKLANALLHLFCSCSFTQHYVFRLHHVTLCLSSSFPLTAALCSKVDITCLFYLLAFSVIDGWISHNIPSCTQGWGGHSCVGPFTGLSWLTLGMKAGAAELSQGSMPAQCN